MILRVCQNSPDILVIADNFKAMLLIIQCGNVLWIIPLILEMIIRIKKKPTLAICLLKKSRISGGNCRGI